MLEKEQKNHQHHLPEPSFKRLLLLPMLALLVLWHCSPFSCFNKSIKNPLDRALILLDKHPIVDGHIDLPILARESFVNDLDSFDLRRKTFGQVDIPRLRKGKVGGFFWSVYVACPEDAGFPMDNAGNFTTPTWRTRDTLEQIDVTQRIVEKYSDTFELVKTASEWKRAMKEGKIAGMIGVEGAHQMGNSLGVLRTYYNLGVRYMTLTHTCNNAVADSCGIQSIPIVPRWGGLSTFGNATVREMNRLGMIVDVSHTHPATASDVLSYSLAPPIFSHSNARGIHRAVRNVADTTLRRIGRLDHPDRMYNLTLDGEEGLGWGIDNGEDLKAIPSGDAIIMLNFSPHFVSETDDGAGLRANVSLVADHADYLAKLAGHAHIGIGSDFDGIEKVPEGLEDVSHYPSLIAELISRGWTDSQIAGLTSGNILRIIEKVEKVAKSMRRLSPDNTVFSGRTDLKKRPQPT